MEGEGGRPSSRPTSVLFDGGPVKVTEGCSPVTEPPRPILGMLMEEGKVC